MTKRFGQMAFDARSERWWYEDKQGAFGLHCGDGVAFRLGDRYVEGRLELAEDWYVIFMNTPFTLRRNTVYPVRVE